MSSARLVPGDVIAVAVPPGLGIVQFTGTDPATGVSTIRVVPGVFSSIPRDVGRQLDERGYYTLCPIEESLKDGTGKVVASFPVAKRFPDDYRRPALDPREWVIIRGNNRAIVKEPSDSERELSIRAIWPLARLRVLLRAGWVPRYETLAGDTGFTGEDGDLGEQGHVTHFLYASNPPALAKLETGLKARGFSYRLRETPPGWLIQVFTEGEAAEISVVENELEALGAQSDVEYDGWAYALT